ncbi:PRP38 family [Nesidiocoris tenuis]|uniref:Pre-mRNA-splicing factor 38 n=1 Tax=Nesidiocoris tenuis TaxID=355587 RepID=A0ABN7AZF5_9HEMI|nr:PRP38 family [Nesidiocoris tenuis]
MANRTVKDAKSIRGTNPQFLIEKIIRSRIYECKYWKEECFALSAELIVDKAMELRFLGGVYGGNIKPTPFLCLTLKMLQIQPEKDIIVEFIKNEEFKYVRALGAMYMRLVGTSIECYKYLEPLLNDGRKLRYQTREGTFMLTFMDEFIDQLLHEERMYDVILPRIQKRHVLEEANELDSRVSALDDDADDNVDSSGDEDDQPPPEKSSSRREDRKSGRASPVATGREKERDRSKERERRHRPEREREREGREKVRDRGEKVRARSRSRDRPRHRSRSADRGRMDHRGGGMRDRDRERDHVDRDHGDRDRDRDRDYGDRDREYHRAPPKDDRAGGAKRRRDDDHRYEIANQEKYGYDRDRDRDNYDRRRDHRDRDRANFYG